MVIDRNFVNDGCDFTGRQIKLGDIILRAVGENLNVKLETRRVVKVGVKFSLSPRTTLRSRYQKGPSRISTLHYSGRCLVIKSGFFSELKEFLKKLFKNDY